MFLGAGAAYGNEAWVCRATGKVICHGDEAELWGPVPDGIDVADRYVRVPDAHALGLGRPLALEFARARLPECHDEVRRIFSRRGAHARFRDLLDRRDKLQAWYDWEHEKTRQALRQWCAESGIPVAG